MMEQDWSLVLSFLPHNWRDLAVSTNAVKGLRKAKSPANLLRALMIHLACGYSLRETAVRVREAELGDFSDVALLKRLRKSKDWLCLLCVSLFQERGVPVGTPSEAQFRLFDATNVKEPGKTGSLWRIHYSIQVPSLECDFFKITGTRGGGTGESFSQFPVRSGDYIVADRGYSKAKGIEYLVSQGAFVSVRVNTSSLVVHEAGEKFPWLQRLAELDAAGKIGSWPVAIPTKSGGEIPGRLCAIRKSEEAIRQAQEKLRIKASKQSVHPRPETSLLAQYVIIFTTFPNHTFSPEKILEGYRFRWQVELVFKRFKQIAQLGHLPKHDEESAKAWLYGKLLTALITEKMIHHAAAISPWGYPL